MPHLLRLARGRRAFAVVALSAFAVAAGCTESTNEAGQEPEFVPDNTSKDAGRSNTDSSTATPALDAGTDAKQQQGDACADGGCAPPSGCAAHPEASFCDDFDSPDALTANKTKWDFIEPTDQPVATLSNERAVSAPSSLLSRIIDGTTPGAKFAKTITKAGFTEVTWAYDIYLSNIGNEDGFFLDDFQFTDAAGPDSFGFRLVMFAEGTALRELKVEHNRGANGGEYVIEPALPAGTVELGKWHHFEQTVKFTFASGDTGANTVQYSLRIDDSATPAFQKEYPGITREQAAFARIAGMPLVFNKERSAGLAIHWDNHILEMK